jgi:hypothetical protein
VAVLDTPPAAAVIVTLVEIATVSVEIVNVAEAAPAVTVTDAGTVAAAVFDEVSVTTAPPAGAGPSRVTVPVELAVPNAVVGSSVSPYATAEGVVVSAAVFDAPAFAAVIVDAPEVVAGNVAIPKVIRVAPAGIVTLAATNARVVTELVKVTTVPPTGAGRFNVAVPVAP